MRKRRRRRFFSPPAKSTNRQGVISVVGIALFVMSFGTLLIVRHERVLQQLRGEWIAVPWQSEWPELPNAPQGPREDIRRAVYSFSGAKPEIMKHIPCFCGCRTMGHTSAHDCYVKERSPRGVVAEWNDHGLACPLATDISGDVMLLYERREPLANIRSRIDEEFGQRGPATETPRPPH